MRRRTALQHALVTTALATSIRSLAAAETPVAIDQLAQGELSQPIFIATWPFGQAACERARSVISSGNSLLDAIERGINLTELDESIDSVGFGGLPNAAGVVQLDASFMDGRTQKAGAVAALEGFPNPISVARRVMEQTKHVMLAGADAGQFAVQSGFVKRDMLSPAARSAWEQWKVAKQSVPTHDTIALLGLAADGHLAGGCSTSGLAYKLPGRVGDSPLIGAGLYVDGQVGAAGATGIGENVLRYCGSFLIVEFMRQGMSPTEACSAAIDRIAAGDRRSPAELSVNFIAINARGQVGAAGTDANFLCAVTDGQRSLLVQPMLVIAAK
ncbi:MAG: N(4)-(beta-N-acetylglucosaminyl)-L-asparaginase [Aureliella sp.]